MATVLAHSLSTQRQAIQLLPTRPLRVLTLTPFYPSQENLAQGCFIAEPLQEMEAQGVETEVVAVQPFYRGDARPLAGGPPVRWQKYFSLPGNFGLPLSGTFAAASLVRRVLARHRRTPFNLIHAHSALPCGAAALSLSGRLGIPFVVTVHGLDAYSTLQAGPVLGKWCQRISKRVYESASAVICISSKVRDQVAKGVAARSVVVYNGVDTSLFFPGPSSAPTILSVGNLIPIKGHAVLLHAFARVRPAVADWKVEIIGEGPKRKELQALAATLGIAHQVRFLGRQNRSDVADAMRRCGIFVLPSGYEGLGCVYLEAMASGKPAIGCNGQGIEEIIESGRNGVLVAPENEAELSDALLCLLRDTELRHRLGVAARETVLARHSIAHQAAQLAEIYRGCA
jgi:teichuronic acid biosynthesis glycosyltransferase TuaC